MGKPKWWQVPPPDAPEWSHRGATPDRFRIDALGALSNAIDVLDDRRHPVRGRPTAEDRHHASSSLREVMRILGLVREADSPGVLRDAADLLCILGKDADEVLP